MQLTTPATRRTSLSQDTGSSLLALLAVRPARGPSALALCLFRSGAGAAAAAGSLQERARPPFAGGGFPWVRAGCCPDGGVPSAGRASPPPMSLLCPAATSEPAPFPNVDVRAVLYSSWRHGNHSNLLAIPLPHAFHRQGYFVGWASLKVL